MGLGEWHPRALSAGVVASLLATGIAALVVREIHKNKNEGCAPFGVYAQNVWIPYGARKLDSPAPLPNKSGGFAPNEIIKVDGWKHAVTAYPNNRPPYNSDIWFRLADHSGWVAFAAVRGLPTANDPSGQGDGGPTADAPSSCEINS